MRSHAARRCRFNRGIFHGSVSCVRLSPLTNSEVRAKSIKFIERAPAVRKRSRLWISICAVLERHGYTCRGCGAVLLRCYDVPSVLTCSRNTCSAAIIIAAGYNVSAVKHARQEGFGEVYQVPCTEGCPDHSAVEVGPEGQHHVQAGLVSRRLGKSKVCFSPYNLSGFTLLISMFHIYFYFYFQDVRMCVYSECYCYN